MGFSLFLIDSEQANINKLDKKGLLPISKMDKVTLNNWEMAVYKS